MTHHFTRAHVHKSHYISMRDAWASNWNEIVFEPQRVCLEDQSSTVSSSWNTVSDLNCLVHDFNSDVHKGLHKMFETGTTKHNHNSLMYEKGIINKKQTKYHISFLLSFIFSFFVLVSWVVFRFSRYHYYSVRFNFLFLFLDSEEKTQKIKKSKHILVLGFYPAAHCISALCYLSCIRIQNIRSDARQKSLWCERRMVILSNESLVIPLLFAIWTIFMSFFFFFAYLLFLFLCHIFHALRSGFLVALTNDFGSRQTSEHAERKNMEKRKKKTFSIRFHLNGKRK